MSALPDLWNYVGRFTEPGKPRAYTQRNCREESADEAARNLTYKFFDGEYGLPDLVIKCTQRGELYTYYSVYPKGAAHLRMRLSVKRTVPATDAQKEARAKRGKPKRRMGEVERQEALSKRRRARDDLSEVRAAQRKIVEAKRRARTLKEFGRTEGWGRAESGHEE